MKELIHTMTTGLEDFATHLGTHHECEKTACGSVVASYDASFNVVDPECWEQVTCGLCKRTSFYARVKRQAQNEKRQARRREKRAKERGPELADILDSIINTLDGPTKGRRKQLKLQLERAKKTLDWINE